MVVITGDKKEIAIIVDMLNNTEADACTSTERNSPPNVFEIQGKYGKEDLDFQVKLEVQ